MNNYKQVVENDMKHSRNTNKSVLEEFEDAPRYKSISFLFYEKGDDDMNDEASCALA